MTNEEIIQRGQLINDETEPAQNTSERVGGVIKGIGQNLADKDTAIAAEAARNGYYQCTVSGTTLAVTAPGFTLPAHGGNIRIKMSAPATGACTLNINSTGPKALLYNGAALSSTNTWEKDEIISVFYDPSGSGQYLASNSQGGGADLKVKNTDADLDIADDYDNVVMRLSEGHVKTKHFDSRDVKTFVGDADNADLDFTDEQGNVVMRVANGHVRTKNFDSENIPINSKVLNFVNDKYKGLRCAIVGDSISSYVGTSPSNYQARYPESDVTSVNQMWWKIVCDTLEMIPVNCSWRGTKVVGAPKGNATAACSDARVADMGRDGDPDIVIFFIGCNDWGSSNAPVAEYGSWNLDDLIIDDSNYSSTQTINDFGAAYSLMLAKTHRAYPHARLFCCTIMDELLRDDDKQYPPINVRGVSNYEWNKKIKDITEALGASCVDVHDCGINCFNIVHYCTDDTGSQGTALHPNKAGMALIAQKVISALIAE